MELLNEIREGFATVRNSYKIMHNIEYKYKSYIIHKDNSYGIAFKCDDSLIVNESFANCRLQTKHLGIENRKSNYLVLSCYFDYYRNEFARICQDFVDPGYEGENRIRILNNPYKWWNKWRELIGNAIVIKEVYSIIAEMMVLYSKMEEGSDVVWTAGYFGTHDLESKDISYEVKSTLKKYRSEIVISSQFQLAKEENLKLYFIRMEKSEEGKSINDMATLLVGRGYDKNLLEKQLNELGFEYGSEIRKKKYRAIERRIYEIDEKFPAITEKSFKGDRFPKGIKKIQYTVDLDGIEYINY